MNRYLLAGIAVAYIGAEASENPFDLKKNLQNLDTEQSSLLIQLRKSAKSDQFLEDEPAKETNTTQQTVVSENASEQPAIKEKEVQTPKATPIVPQESATPVTQSEVAPVETNASSQTVQKTESKEEPVGVEPAKSPEKLMIEIKPKEEVKQPLEADNDKSKQAVLDIEMTDPQQKKNDLPPQDGTINQDEIEKLYLEAIKEVGGK